MNDKAEHPTNYTVIHVAKIAVDFDFNAFICILQKECALSNLGYLLI